MSAPEPRSDAVPELTVPPVDVVDDLHGDPLRADLVVFLNGNQFMVMDEVMAAFQRAMPAVCSVFYETLPPGILVEQVRQGSLRMGDLIVSVPPDVLAAGPDQLDALHAEGWVGAPVEYASNDLALLVRTGNPAGIRELGDLGREGVRIAMPNPATEGVGRLIGKALVKAGGEALRARVLGEKVASGETRLTRIHHRESIRWLEAGEVDVAPLWSTEARFHVGRGAAVWQIVIPDERNETGRYALAVVERRARHREAAEAFLAFMRGPEAQSIYRRYGFAPPVASRRAS